MTELVVKQLCTTGASAEAIQAHYDISNDFYALWLDPAMVYSCALWDGDDVLSNAQLRKLDFHLEQVDAWGKKHLLDIGCGWGALMGRAVERYQVERVTGLTLSMAQTEWVKRKGHASVSVRLESWEEHVPVDPYDAIVSIGAFEHFAKVGFSKDEKIEAYRRFFKWCHDISSSDCALSLQSIVYENYDEKRPSALVEEIFPESELPRLAEIIAACEGLYEIVHIRNDRSDYAKTLQKWLSNLRGHRNAAVEIVGEDTYKKFEVYLGVFVIGFHTGTVNLARIKLRKIATPVFFR